MRRLAVLSAVMLLLLVGAPRISHAMGDVNSYATCGNDGMISVHWSFYEYAGYPTGHPEWVGWDVLRRRVGTCEAFVRVNANPFPRLAGSHEHTYVEAPALAGTMFEYRVIPVDANRQQVSFECGQCSVESWSSCPNISAPITMGTLQDFGWTLYIQPCQQGCYDSFYLAGPWPQELRALAGTGTVVRFCGDPACGTIEGCALNYVSHEVAPCGSTPTRRASWGELKSIYR